MRYTEKMRLSALLLFCGLVCLGEQLSLLPATDQDVHTSRPTEDRVLQVQMEVDGPESWSLSVGSSVEIRCSLSQGSDLDETETLNLHLEKRTMSSIERLPAIPLSKGISYTLNPVSLEDRGLYSCRGGITTHPKITVESAHKLIWVNDSSAAASLEFLKVNRVKYFYEKTFTIGCKLPNDQSEWKIMSASEKTGSITECPNQQRSGDVLSCTIPSLPFPVSKSRRYDPFWCESSTRQKTNIFNMTQAEITEQAGRDLIVTRFEVSPAWFVREGDSVVIQCKVGLDKQNNSDKCDLQLIWTKRNPGNDMTVVLSQRASKPINYTISNITHEHSGVYSCWDDGTLSNVFALPWHHFIWVQDHSPPVTINVLSHNRTQFFHNEEVTMGCQLPNDQSQWKLKGFDKWTGVIKECERSELSSSGLLSCTVKLGYPWTEYLYWCESSTGIRSNVLKMTNTVIDVVLEAPPLPVMEGDDFTLRCLRKNKATGEIKPEESMKSFFHHNSRTLGWSNVGSVTLKNVTKENEGFYSCRPDDRVATLDAYVTVKARPQEQKKNN